MHVLCGKWIEIEKLLFQLNMTLVFEREVLSGGFVGKAGSRQLAGQTPRSGMIERVHDYPEKGWSVPQWQAAEWNGRARHRAGIVASCQVERRTQSFHRVHVQTRQKLGLQETEEEIQEQEVQVQDHGRLWPPQRLDSWSLVSLISNQVVILWQPVEHCTWFCCGWSCSACGIYQYH